MNKQSYQGDISIIKLTKEQIAQVNFQPLKERELVVAYGENTGHRHRVIVDDPQTKIEFSKDQFGYYLKVSGGEAKLVHDKHETHTIPQGVFFIGNQYEYDEAKELKRVLD